MEMQIVAKSIFPHSLCEYNGGEVLQTYRDNYK